VGSFNPAIFHPSWLAVNNLIRREEADEAKVDIVTADASIFTVGWCIVQVVQQRLLLHSADPTKQAPLRDLAIGIIQVLEHTPVDAFGLNRDRHIRMESEESWHAFGDYLAPKPPWDGIIQKPRLRSLLMESRLDPGGKDFVQVRVEPSTRVEPHGLYMNVHQHYQVKTEEDRGPTAARFCSLLASSWQDFLTFSEGVSESLLKRFDEVQR
jgi:hypothetical protein